MSLDKIQRNQEIAKDLAGFRYDPYGFVMYAYPWGKKGTFLEKWDGPDTWQTKTLREIGRLMHESDNVTHDPVRILRRSGHEIGKTALIAWIIQWWNCTRDNPVGVVTANTKLQLETKTWRELAKWHSLLICNEWYEWTATKYQLKAQRATWFTAAVPWTKERSEAFAGTHEKRGVLMIFDEASLIEDVIWEVADGAMDEGSLWVAFGNPTKNTGRFHENAVGRFRHRWHADRVDSRTSKVANQKRIEQWINDYGEDSDYVRVRVLGEFPRAAASQFIGTDLVYEAATRTVLEKDILHAPRIIGVDVARFGDDQSVIIRRQGIYAFDIKKFRQIDLMRFASIVIQEIKLFNPHAVFVDATGGYGAAVVDRLRQLEYSVIEVGFGRAASNDRKYANKRMEIWARMKEWLENGGVIPDDDELKADLVAPEYSFDKKDRIILEAKEDMKSRGVASPDIADALACTFAEHIMVEDDRSELFRTGRTGVMPASGEFDPTSQIQRVKERWTRKRRR